MTGTRGNLKELMQMVADEQNKEKLNSKFNAELKRVYSEIDKNSNLLWPVKDEFELISRNLTRASRGTRSGTKIEDK